MKTILSTVVGVLLFISCEEDLPSSAANFNLGDTLTLSINETAYSTDSSLSITLDSILGDSRCPINATCIWAGVGTVRFLFTENQNNHPLTLSTHQDFDFERDTTLGSYRVELIDLFPYPVLDQTINPEDIEALIVISKEKKD